MQDDRVKRNRVKPIAHLTDNLAEPQLAEATVAPEQFDVTNRWICFYVVQQQSEGCITDESIVNAPRLSSLTELSN